jgi:hypothetical protein
VPAAAYSRGTHRCDQVILGNRELVWAETETIGHEGNGDLKRVVVLAPRPQDDPVVPKFYVGHVSGIVV